MPNPGKTPEQKRRIGNPGKRPLAKVSELPPVRPISADAATATPTEALRAVIDAAGWLAEADTLILVLLRQALEERVALRPAVLADDAESSAPSTSRSARC